MTGRVWLIGGAAAVVVALILVFSFSSSDTRATDETQSMVLHRGNLAEPSTLDPQRTDGTWENRIVADLFQGLYANAADSSVIWGDANAVDVSEDGLTYTFTLRDDLAWSDGMALTAFDYQYAFRRMVNPETTAPLAFFYYNIVGARAINLGEISDLTELGANALDERTFQIDLIQPDPHFAALLTNQPFFPVPSWVIEEAGDQWSRPGTMVSNGPYVLAEWVPNDRVKAVRNPYFYDNANVAIDEVYYYPTDDSSSALRRFRAGEIDLNMEFPEQQIDWLREHMPEETRTGPSICVGYISLNTERPPFDDARVRQALSMSIDRDMLVERVLRLGEIPAYSIVTPFAAGYTAPEPDWLALSFSERQDRARALLAEAGFSPDQPLQFTYRYRESIKNRRAAIAVANMWEEIGADVNLVNTEVAVHYDDMQAGNFEVGDAGWCAFVTKAEELLSLSHSDLGSYNYANYGSAEFEALYDEALTVADLERRNALLNQAETILIDDMPLIPTYYYADKNLVGRQVQGWVDNPNNTHLTRWLSVDESLRPEQVSFVDRIMGLFN